MVRNSQSNNNVKMHELNSRINCVNEIPLWWWSKCAKFIVQRKKKLKSKENELHTAIMYTIGIIPHFCVYMRFFEFYLIKWRKWRSMCDWISALRFAWLIYNCKRRRFIVSSRAQIHSVRSFQCAFTSVPAWSLAH